MSYRPRLRDHLGVTEDGVLVDPLGDRDIQLSALGRALAGRLDGEHELDALLGALVAAGAARADAETAFRWLLLVHAVEGAGDGVAARLRRVARGEDRLGLVLLDGARFECQGSGACCQNYVFGPLDDEDIERLDALDLERTFPEVAAPYVVADARGIRHLRSVDDRCVFLGDDRRCGLHARFGGDAKPRVCRLYPLEAYATVAGLRVVDAGSCARFATSARRGLPLAEDLERLKPLLGGQHELHHPILTIAGIPCDFGIFLELTRAASLLVKHGDGTAPELLAAIGEGLAGLRAALASCPLEPGQPDGVVARALAEPLAWRPAAADDAHALAEVAESVAAAIEGKEGPVVRDAVRHLRVVAAAGRGALPPGAAVPLDDPEVDAVLRLSLRQQLFGSRALVELHAAAGLVRMALVLASAVWGARLQAAAAGRAATAADLSRGHAAAVRALDLIAAERALVEAEPRWRQALAGLPIVAGYRRPMP